jgi:cupin 2 domain-containing protein
MTLTWLPVFIVEETSRTPVNIQNLFQNAAPPVTGERFETLLKHKNLVIERICSSADIPLTPYVQTQDEWVLLIQGTAEIEIAGKLESFKSGDYVFLPANTPHCLKSVSEGALWLAVHLHQDYEMRDTSLALQPPPPG